MGLGYLCELGNTRYLVAPLILLVPWNIINITMCLVTLLPIYFTKPSRFNSKDLKNKDFSVAFGWTCLFYFTLGILVWELILLIGCARIEKTKYGSIGATIGKFLS